MAHCFFLRRSHIVLSWTYVTIYLCLINHGHYLIMHVSDAYKLLNHVWVVASSSIREKVKSSVQRKYFLALFSSLRWNITQETTSSKASRVTYYNYKTTQQVINTADWRIVSVQRYLIAIFRLAYYKNRDEEKWMKWPAFTYTYIRTYISAEEVMKNKEDDRRDDLSTRSLFFISVK